MLVLRVDIVISFETNFKVIELRRICWIQGFCEALARCLYRAEDRWALRKLTMISEVRNFAPNTRLRRHYWFSYVMHNKKSSLIIIGDFSETLGQNTNIATQT
jgi:hypothetical protein